MTSLLIKDIVLLRPIYKFGELCQFGAAESLVQSFWWVADGPGFAVRKIIQICFQRKLSLKHKTVAYDAIFPYQQNSLFILYCVCNVMTSTACFITQAIWAVALNARFGLITQHFINISGSNCCLCLWKCIRLTPEVLRIWPLPFSHYRKRPAKMRNYSRRVEY